MQFLTSLRNYFVLTIVITLLTSCSTISMKNTYHSGKNHNEESIGRYVVKEFEVTLSEKISAQENASTHLSQIKSSLNKKIENGNYDYEPDEEDEDIDLPINVVLRIEITNLKVKGGFARVNRMLGGYDVIEANVEVLSTNGDNIKNYSSKLESGVISREEYLFNLAASTFLQGVFGKESKETRYK